MRRSAFALLGVIVLAACGSEGGPEPDENQGGAGAGAGAAGGRASGGAAGGASIAGNAGHAPIAGAAGTGDGTAGDTSNAGSAGQFGDGGASGDTSNAGSSGQPASGGAAGEGSNAGSGGQSDGGAAGQGGNAGNAGSGGSAGSGGKGGSAGSAGGSGDICEASPDSTACGSGCVCKGHIRTEAICSDALDNDGDGTKNCTDSDCDDQICRSTKLLKLATKDFSRTLGETLVDKDGETTITIAKEPTGETQAILEFSNVIKRPGVNILTAKLRVFVETPNVRIKAFAPDGTELVGPAAAPSVAQFHEFDVRDYTQKLVDGTETIRQITVKWGGSEDGTAVIRTLEFDGITSDPGINYRYETRCFAQKCEAL